MITASFPSASFPSANCPRCERNVVLHWMQVDGELMTACLHCDALIDADSSSSYRELGSNALRGLGYAFEGDPPLTEPEGCGKPNCNKGNCKNSGRKHPFSETTHDAH